MNFKIILFAFSIIQLAVCHPISNGSSYCSYKSKKSEDYSISVNCKGLTLHTGICDHLMKDLDLFDIAKFENCEISEWSDIFKIFPSVKKLVFSDNNTLSSGNFSQVDHLSMFVMMNSNFKTTPTSFSLNGPNLKMFQFIGNQSNNIDSLSLENSTKLELFSLENTTLSHLPAEFFKNSTNLTAVHLSFNKIKSIDSIEWPNSVKWINFVSNKIAKLTKHSFRNLSNLEILELNKNEIGEIEEDAFCELKNLSRLEIRENHIEELTTKTFAGLKELKLLNLADNQIEVIEVGAFQNTPKLWHLVLKRNNISSLNRHVFGRLNVLSSLDLSGNPISEIKIDAFSELSELKHLNVSSGNLETIDFGIFAKIIGLDVLDLSNNKISRLIKMNSKLIPDVNITKYDVTISKFKDLFPSYYFWFFEFAKWSEPLYREGIYLNGQTWDLIKHYFLSHKDRIDHLEDIKEIWPALFPLLISKFNTTGHRLNKLYLSGNELTVIEKFIFADMKNLEKLYLSNNPIVTLYPESFSGLTELKILYIDHCELTAIDFSLFAHMEKLQILNLSYNKLLTITATAFPSLGILSLSSNRLSAVPLKRENMPGLFYFDVSNNKNLNCSSLDEFVKIFSFQCESDSDQWKHADEKCSFFVDVYSQYHGVDICY